MDWAVPVHTRMRGGGVLKDDGTLKRVVEAGGGPPHQALRKEFNTAYRKNDRLQGGGPCEDIQDQNTRTCIQRLIHWIEILKHAGESQPSHDRLLIESSEKIQDKNTKTCIQLLIQWIELSGEVQPSHDILIESSEKIQDKNTRTCIQDLICRIEILALTNDEVNAIHEYTVGTYHQINRSLRTSTVTPKMKADIDLISSGLQKLPVYTGEVLHVKMMMPPAFSKQVVKGKIITFSSFISTSQLGKYLHGSDLLQDELYQFPEPSYIFKWKSKSGHDISCMSLQAIREYEILFNPGLRLQIDRITKQQNRGELFTVNCTEMDRQRI